jgi:hypothetical protein
MALNYLIKRRVVPPRMLSFLRRATSPSRSIIRSSRCMTVVKVGRTQEHLLCEDLNLELDQIVDLTPEGKNSCCTIENARSSSRVSSQTWT